MNACDHREVFVFETGTGRSFAACLACDPVRVWKVVRVTIPDLTGRLAERTPDVRIWREDKS